MSILIMQNGKGQKIEFGTMHIPNRKNKALVKIRGATIEVLAYFRNDECEKEFDKIMDSILDAYNAYIKK